MKLSLGIDAGGTQTRWALADAGQQIVSEGVVAGWSALQLASDSGRQALQAILTELAGAVRASGQVYTVCAGLTGFGGDGAALSGWMGEALGLPAAAIALRSDIEIACLDSFAPGEGYLVYAGTGSIAAWIDQDGALQRAGGRGVTLDDGGGGYWIAREALRHIWRSEDEAPGAWRHSPMAHAIFDHVGGSDWSFSRQFMNGQPRGAIGMLALAVAATAEDDPAARRILQDAGRELARIAQALVARYGERPIVLAGRAAELHPLIAQSMRVALAPLPVEQKSLRPHHAAARLAQRLALHSSP